jgi:CRP/FNR family cyclic AMP-dependent transcriptional regulator
MALARSSLFVDDARGSRSADRKGAVVETGEALARAPVFSNLNIDILNSLARSARTRRFAQGEFLVKEGEEAAAFFLICEGQAEVIKGAGSDDEVVVGHLTNGDFFGEMALLDGFPRSASVRAVSDCECLVLARWDFVGVLKSSPDIGLSILTVLSRRLRECEDQMLP